MKKVTSILIALICLMSTLSAYAETDIGFILRGGICFGDDPQTVGERETWMPINGNHIFKYEGTLAGMPGMVTYWYDKEQLHQVLYCLGTKYDSDGKTIYATNDVQFREMRNALELKYGLPFCNEQTGDIYTDAKLSSYVQYLTYCTIKGEADFENISGCAARAAWIFPGSNYNVLIDLRKYEVLQDGQKCYLILLEYCRYTEEDARVYSEILKDL